MNTTFKHKTRAGREYEIKYKTNNNGFRIPFDFSISDKYEKKDNELVILLIGGSTALGVGSSDDETITKLLESKLENKLPNYEFKVLNLGVGAANTYQEYLVLDLYGKILILIGLFHLLEEMMVLIHFIMTWEQVIQMGLYIRKI